MDGPTLLDYKRADEKNYAERGARGAGEKAKKEIRKAAEFVGWFAAFALLAFAALSLQPVAMALSGLAAAQSSFFLSVAGVHNNIEWTDGVPHIIGNVGNVVDGDAQNAGNTGFDAEIGELCWGKIEFAVLFGILAASFDRSRRQRLFGFVAGFIFFALFFNPLRITLSILWQSPLVHDVLFRVTLAAAIAFYYFLWYALTGRRSARKNYSEGGVFEF